MTSPVPRVLGLAVLAVACSPRVQTAEVVSLPRAVAIAPTPESADHCAVAGTGELVEANVEAPEFFVFAEPRSTAHGLTILETTKVGVTWSSFPSTADGAGLRRAAITIGGQKLIRAHAFADLAGRGFQLRVTTFVVPDHAWIDCGVQVEVVGIERGSLVVRRKSPFARPEFFEPRAPCATVAYEPTALDPPSDTTDDDEDAVGPTGDALVLRDAPAGAEVLTLGFDGDGIALSVRERRGDWLRVAWHSGGLGIDGWVRASEVDGSASYRGFGMSGVGGSGGSSRPRRLRVRTEAPVLVGDDHQPFGDAVFERGALLDGWETDGHAIRVELRGREIGADDGMWIAEGAVEPE